MTTSELQKAIESARVEYIPGRPMDAGADQCILLGIIDGLSGDDPSATENLAWRAGIEIGLKLRRALR
jgi:hypothetical protein